MVEEVKNDLHNVNIGRDYIGGNQIVIHASHSEGKEKLEEKTCIYLSFQINAQLKNRIKNKSYFSHF